MVLEDAEIEVFGLLTSKMHNIWLKLVGGKLKCDPRYSESSVYNTFPIPENIEKLKKYAQKILDVRQQYSDSLEVLYDPLTMPSDLKAAHKALDKAVEQLYQKKPFESDQERKIFLLEKYAIMLNSSP